MCGRFLLSSNINILKARYNIDEALPELYPQGEVFPSEQVPVILRNGTTKMTKMQWGFRPSFTSRTLINARSETVDKKPLFKSSFYKRRCIIPANAFFEWKSDGSRKIKYQISPVNKELFSLAGIYGRFQTRQGNLVTSFVIITTRAACEMKDIHTRMPVILPEEVESVWLDQEQDVSIFKDYLKPYPGSLEIIPL